MELNINGKKYTADAPEGMPLLWVLRDLLGLTGTKYGCGQGLCGACTVLLNGQAIRSCNFPSERVEGADIITIEGLEQVHKELQEAWQICNTPQCGYCQPGQLMTAAGLLNANPNPGEAEIIEAMQGNICRCGTYGRIKKSILKAVELKING